MKQLNAREVARLLVPRGWVCVRMNGSHAQYKHPDYRDLITVAGHGSRPIPEPLLKKILKTAEIDPSEV